MIASEIVNKVWNYAHVLRDDGVGYGDYVEQITYLIILKMADEREKAGIPLHQITRIGENPYLSPLPVTLTPASPSGEGFFKEFRILLSIRFINSIHPVLVLINKGRSNSC